MSRHSSIITAEWPPPYLRVTNLQAAEECPARWWAELRGELPRRESKAANIGTAMHQVIEDFVTGAITRVEELEKPLVAAGVTETERRNVLRYVGELSDMRLRTLAVEREFELELLPGAPLVRGHVDYVGVADDGALHVIDHKSNRGWDDAGYWSRKLQTVLYSWAARKLWPEHAERVRFSIGYVNLGGFVTWEVSSDLADHAAERYGKIWADVLRFREAGDFEQRFHDGCSWCGLRERCAEYGRHVTDFRASVDDLLSQRALPERWSLLKQVIKVAKSALDDVEVELKKNVEESGGAWFAGDVIVTTQRNSRRVADFADVWRVLEGVVAEYPEAADRLRAAWPELFSVKVGGVDELCRDLPPLRALITPVIRRKAHDEVTVVVKPVQGALQADNFQQISP